MTTIDSDLGTPFDRVKLLREEIRFEHGVIGTRLAALLVSQPFLFAAFAVAGQGTTRHPYLAFEWFPYVMVPLMGLLSSFLVLLGISEGIRRIRKLREHLYGQGSEFAAIAEKICPPLDKRGQAISLLYAVALPVLFLLGWLAIAWAGTLMWLKGGSA